MPVFYVLLEGIGTGSCRGTWGSVSGNMVLCKLDKNMPCKPSPSRSRGSTEQRSSVPIGREIWHYLAHKPKGAGWCCVGAQLSVPGSKH